MANRISAENIGHRGLAISLMALSLALAFAPGVHAGATFDGSMGAAGALSGNFVIPADRGQQVGGNLFHSFSRFSVNTGESASFAGPANISNVIARVTGGESSWIDGPLGSSIPGANLYLLNPAGIAFGPNASLDLTGSFHASTADYLKLGETGRFPAALGAAAVLTADPPSAFGFLSPNPAAIDMHGSFLSVVEGKQIVLVGGDITLDDSTLYAPGGGVQLVSVGSAGTVGQDSIGGWTNLGGFGKLGNIAISDNPETPPQEVPEVSPIGSIDVSNYNSFGPGGKIIMRSANLAVRSAYISADTIGFGAGSGIDVEATNEVKLTDGAAMTVSSFFGGDGGVASIKAGNILLDTGASVLADSVFDSGAGGTVKLQAETIRVDRGAAIFSLTDGAGQAANIYVTASKSLTLNGVADFDLPSSIQSISMGSGNAGNISIKAPLLEISNGAGISVANYSSGGGGRVTVDVDDLKLLNGGAITASNLGDGPGGTLDITASNSVSLSGFFGPNRDQARLAASAYSTGTGGEILVSTPLLKISTGGAIMAFAYSDGNAGNISLRTSTIVIEGDNANVTTNTGNSSDLTMHGSGHGGILDVYASDSISISGHKSGFFSNSHGEGDGGTIRVTTDKLTLTGGGAIEARAYQIGKGGDISIDANTINLSSQAFVAAGSVGTGETGTIKITAHDSLRMSDASITTEAINSTGGDMQIAVGKLIFLQDSQITTSVQGGLGNGGNIFIDPDFVVLNSSRIIANAYGGNGGNIGIVAGNFFADPNSLVQASSQLGIDGSVVIEAPHTDVGTNLALLRQSFADTGALLNSVCAAQEADHASSFVVTGRATLPPSPHDWLLSSPTSLFRTGANASKPGGRPGAATE